MDKLVAHGATGPAATEHGLVPIQPLLADFAISGLDPQQHRLPIATGFSDTHKEEYSGRVSSNTRSTLHFSSFHFQAKGSERFTLP